MTSSATPQDSRLPNSKPVLPQSKESKQKDHASRPDGESGGHTVQDWEQPSPRPMAQTLSDPISSPSTEPASTVVPPSPIPASDPEVEALYLRPHRATRRDEVVAPLSPLAPLVSTPPDAVVVGGLAAGSETLIDAITRTVSALLEQSLHESVTAAVRALAPRMVISFPVVGAQEPVPDVASPSDDPAEVSGSTAADRPSGLPQ